MKKLKLILGQLSFLCLIGLSTESLAWEVKIDSVNLFENGGYKYIRLGVTPDPGANLCGSQDFILAIAGEDGERYLSMMLVGLASNLTLNIHQVVNPQQASGFCLEGGIRVVTFTLQR